MATFAELTSMNRTKLLKDLETSRKSLFDIRYKVANKQEKASHQIKALKKTIAQILTVLQRTPSETTESKDALENSEEKVQDTGRAEAKTKSKAKSPAVKAIAKHPSGKKSAKVASKK